MQNLSSWQNMLFFLSLNFSILFPAGKLFIQLVLNALSVLCCSFYFFIYLNIFPCIFITFFSFLFFFIPPLIFLSFPYPLLFFFFYSLSCPMAFFHFLMFPHPLLLTSRAAFNFSRIPLCMQSAKWLLVESQVTKRNLSILRISVAEKYFCLY